MKKIFFSLLISCSWAAAQAQLPVYWQTPMPASFAISGSTIRGNVTAMYSDFANSIQRLSADKDGYIEFNAEEPAAGTHFYYIGFAKASSPGTDLIGFQIASNAPSAPGYVYPSIFAPGGAATHPAYFTGSCSAIPAGSLLRIERSGNAIRFWNRTAGCELVYSASTINLSPTEDWIVIFRSLDNNKGAVNTTISFSGTEELWGRTSPTGIRPLSLSDKVGIGKDPAVALDVLGSATISTLAGTGVALTEATANGTFQRKTMGTATQTLMGNGTWAETPWKNAVSPAGAIYFQPTANRYVGINQTAPAANLDINNSTCDNKPAMRITNDESLGCMVGSEHGAFIDCTAFLVGGGTAQRFMVNANGATGIGRAPSYWLDVAGSIRVNTTVYTSDSRFKKDVKEITEPLALLKQLSGKTYRFKTKEFPEWNFEDTKQYGFIAQELKQVMPELVSEDKDGYLGVKYTMLIPVMTEAIKTQQEQIEALKQELAALKQGKATGTPATDAPAMDAYLAQNVPNPFTQTTEISYKLPLNVHQATIGIYDLNGREIRLVQLGQGTTGTISINGGDLKPGMYVYTLIIDGKYFDSKKMILTSQ